MPKHLENIQETSLIPLAIRATESKKKNARLVDTKAMELVQTLHIDTQKFNNFFSYEGIVARTLIIDKEVRIALKKHPKATVLNLGCGFDNRFERTDNGQVQWFNVDLPESIALRQQVFTDKERETTLASDLLDAQSLKQIPVGEAHIIIAEGLFMYFTKEEIKTLLHHLTDRFKQATLIIELMPPKSMNKKRHDTLKHMDIEFGEGFAKAKEILPLQEKLQLSHKINLFDEIKKHSLRGKVTNLFFRSYMNYIAVFTWE